MISTAVFSCYGWKRAYDGLEVRCARMLDPVLLKLLEQASEAHWKTDARLLSAIAASAAPANFKRWMRFLAEWPLESAARLFEMLQELEFLFLSLVPEKRSGTFGEQLSVNLESLLERRPQLLNAETVAIQNVRVDVFRAGELMACGHYDESLANLRMHEKHWDQAPLALQVRRSVICGICHQALGNYVEAHSQLLFQESLAETLADPYLGAAALRRRLSFCIETEDFQQAKRLEMRLRVAVERQSSEFLNTLFLQERIKLALALQTSSEKTLLELQQEQEAFIERGLIHSSLVIPIEERCEIALRSHKPNEALRWIRDQAGISRENGMVNGQLVSGILLLKCQMMLGSAKAASVTLKELEYLCREYRFGRDALKAKVLGLLWELRFGSQKRAIDRLEECIANAEKLSLPQHSTALQFFALLSDPSQLRLQKALGPGPRKRTELFSALQLVLQWLALQGDHESKAFEWISGLLRRLELGSAAWCFFSEWGFLWFVMFHNARGECAENEIRFHWLHFRPGGNHFLLLQFWSSAKPAQVFSWEAIHLKLFPQVPYQEYRHKHRVQVILQNFRSSLRRSLAPWLSELPKIPADFGLTQAARFQFALPCELIELKDLESHLAVVVLKSSKAKLKSQGLLHKNSQEPHFSRARQRNNRPVLGKTIAARTEKVLLWLSSHGPTSGSEMSLAMGYQRKTLHVYLKEMVRQGLIGTSGKGRNAVYFIASGSGGF